MTRVIVVLLAASALPYYPNSQVPREMTRADMDTVIADFVQAVARGERAGFDMVELHAAHGYLLASFISPLTNKRTDDYGGALGNRLRFPLEVFSAMRKAWPDDKPMSVRISATDWQDGGLTGDDAVAVARAFAEIGCDLIDRSRSSHDTLWNSASCGLIIALLRTRFAPSRVAAIRHAFSLYS